ncbi:hypothetical protein M1349_01765 [Patescibacteria group bacterium]|nr:hypothetical protein [Patescibacteria group bacterium]
MAVEQIAQAFRQEFYEGEGLRQRIKTDLISYLGEYRFKVSEFTYAHGISNGTIVDPITKEAWISKTQKAIDQKLSEGLSSSREKAELTGFQKLEEELGKNPQGTVAWLSPQGPKKEGYGDYGFAYVGKKVDDSLQLTAIRLDRPVISEFNRVKRILTNDGDEFEKAEDFLRSPWVIDKDVEDVKALIYEHFWVGDLSSKKIFHQAMLDINSALDSCADIIEKGTIDQKRKAFNTIENLAIEVKKRLEFKEKKTDPQELRSCDHQFSALMQLENYNKQAEKVAGSCGSSGINESNDIFNNLSTLRSIFPNGEKWEYHTGQCRVCNNEGVDVGPCSVCKGCEEKFNESWE